MEYWIIFEYFVKRNNISFSKIKKINIGSCDCLYAYAYVSQDYIYTIDIIWSRSIGKFSELEEKVKHKEIQTGRLCGQQWLPKN